MIQLNLLSPFKKGRLAQLVKFLFVREILEIVILSVSLLAIIHVAGLEILNNFLIDLTQNTLSISKDSTEFNREIGKLNALVRRTRAASINFFPVSPELVRIVQILPPDIKLYSITIDRASQQLTLTGTAETREALLRFQDAIKNASWLSNVTTPVSELFQKANINFEIQTKLLDLPPLLPTPVTSIVPAISNTPTV